MVRTSLLAGFIFFVFLFQIVVCHDLSLFNRMAKVIIIESIYNGTDVYVSEGELVKQMFAPAPGIAPQPNMSDNRFFEGWKHEN